MHKIKYIVIIALILSISINVTAYSSIDFSKVVDALQKLPYLYDLIQEFFIVNGRFSFITFKLVRMLIDFIIGIITISVAKNLVSQGAVSIYRDTKRIFIFGLISFILVFILLVLFFTSLVGFPIGALIFILMYIILLICKPSLQICIGYFIEARFKLNWHIYLDYLLGVIIIEAICFIPYIGQIFLLVIVPMISIGIFINIFLNKYIYKKYYPIPFKQGISERKYDRENIKEVVKRGLKNERR